MVRIVDRRFDSKKKSAVNRQRFLDRYRGQIRKAVADAIAKRGIRDLESGEKIGRKCSTCHEIVAEEESNSALLQELGLQQPPPAPAEDEAPAGT